MCPAYVEDSHFPGPTYGALDHTVELLFFFLLCGSQLSWWGLPVELLAKLLSGSKDPDVTALSEAVKGKLGITEPLPQPALASPSRGWSTLADDVKRSRASRLLRKVTCPSPFFIFPPSTPGVTRGCTVQKALFIPVPERSQSLDYRTCR